MSAARRTPWLLLLALPLWLGTALSASAQALTADINGDGLSDRIEAGRTAGELLVQLSGRETAQRLHIGGTLLDLAVADVDRDGDSDLVATASGRRHIRLLVWTNAGGGRFVSRQPKPAGGGDRARGARLATAIDVPVLDDLSGDPGWLFALPSLALGHHTSRGEGLPAADEFLPARPRSLRRAPRGPPAVQLLS